MKKYKKITGGSLTLVDGRTIEKGDIFEAEEKSIPKPFRAGLQFLEDVTPKEEPKEDPEKDPEKVSKETPKKTVRTK